MAFAHSNIIHQLRKIHHKMYQITKKQARMNTFNKNNGIAKQLHRFVVVLVTPFGRVTTHHTIRQPLAHDDCLEVDNKLNNIMRNDQILPEPLDECPACHCNVLKPGGHTRDYGWLICALCSKVYMYFDGKWTEPQEVLQGLIRMHSSDEDR